MIGVIVSNVFLFLLTMASAAFSGRASLSLALGGLLMILISAGYVTDSGGKLLKTLQLLLAVLFALCSGEWWGLSVFAVLLWSKPWVSILLSDGLLFLWYFPFKMGFFDFLGIHRPSKGGNLGNYLPEVSEQAVRKGHEVTYFLAECLLLVAILTGICLIFSLFRRIEQRALQKAQSDQEKLIALRLSEMHEIRKNKDLMRQNFYAEKNARLIERENMSRNIHNSVGHSITAAIMTLDAADVLFEKKPEEAHRKMNEATERIRGSLESIRSAVRGLDEDGTDITVKDLILYFDNIMDVFMMDTDRKCDRIYEFFDEERVVPREHAEFLTGALEEILTNGVKHGGAMHFSVRLSGDKAHLRLEVRDDGKNDFSEENASERIRNGFGLKKLTAYAERCGGTADFSGGDGFSSVIELPV
ncbi:MAG: hypothetical protein J5825_01980 [Lachnospiraceae bacterium]|nr:hypothetical protein [Lachnospiraceae bacterium]